MLLALVLAACKGPTPPADPDLVPWSTSDDRPALDHGFFDAHPRLRDMLLYASCADADDRPDASHLGVFAIGNGEAFGLVGPGDPMNALHNMVGPGYDFRGRFWSDLRVRLEVDGQVVPFERECAAQVRSGGVVITRSEAGPSTLYTVDYAPADGSTGLDRILVLDGPGTVRFEGANGLEPVAGSIGQRLDDGRAYALFPEVGSIDADGRLTMPDGVDHAGVRIQFALDEADLVAPTGAATDRLEATLDDWEAAAARGVQLRTEDPWIADLYRANRSLIRAETTVGGGSSPMSRYTGVWLRDTSGVIRFLVRAGLIEEAERALADQRTCHIRNGDISNACFEGDRTPPGPEPDWASMPPFGTRTRAEGPSWVPVGYRDVVAATGDWDLVDEHWDYLSRALLGQTMTDEGLQYFSGDETFRAAMNVAYGLELEYPHHEDSYSANSAIAMIAAAKFMVTAANQLGRDAAPFEERLQLARRALDEQFDRGEGWVAYLDAETLEGPETPFDDVTLKAIWTKAFAVDDPVALDNLAWLESLADRGDGTLISQPDSSYIGVFGITEGVETGMLPGYTLGTWTMVGDPRAAQAFEALHGFAGPAGDYGEYLIYDDRSDLAPIYDSNGGVGDFTARCRPWEGAVNMEGLLGYALGNRLEDGVLHLRPHLTGGAGWLEADAIAGLVDLRLEREAGVLTATVTATEATELSLELPAPVGMALAEDQEAEGTLTTLPRGEAVWAFPTVSLVAGETRIFQVRFTDP